MAVSPLLQPQAPSAGGGATTKVKRLWLIRQLNPAHGGDSGINGLELTLIRVAHSHVLSFGRLDLSLTFCTQNKN